ncbi:ABC transporter A family member 2 [Phytophthora citrophthora]|uniref:ABC transporter A family member 2 n=1 Tax=Phytophthora citrophthora TaxID=4793 RepID=A0AAD9LBT4_9STRA|nr:ABC transporter A family member 2 [Phytophthora citrophthora]
MMPTGGPSSPTATTAPSSASSGSAASLLTSSGSSSSSSDGTALLTTCLSTIVTYDYNYALCVMNSGFFELDSSPFGDATSTAISLPSGSSTSGSTTVDASGSCTLMCTKPTLSASSSCCSAASTVMSCKQSSSSINYCKSVIEDTVAESQQCGLSSENTALIVCTAIIVAFFTAVMIAARIYAKKRAAAAFEGGAVESRLALASRATWEAVLAAWRQVTNLIWKNLIIRRRKPVSFVFELFLPVILTLALVFIANLDSIFGTGDNYTSSSEAATTSDTILCTGLDSLAFTDYGALSTNMSTFYSSGQSVIGLFLLISYIKFVSTTTTTMVIEKETRIREVMKIMGLSNFTLLCSWCLTTAILATPLAFIIAAELKFGQVFPMTEYATLVFLFWSLSLSIVSFSYFITPFFSKSRAASIASVLLWLVLFFPFFSVMSKPNSSKYLGALAPPTAFALGIDDLVRRAQLGRGLAYAMGLVESPITVPSAFSMSWFLILDSFILVALGWYFDNVIPQEFGVRKPWNFLFVKEYWIPSKGNSSDKEVLVLESPSTASSPQTDYAFASPRGMRLLHQTSSDGSIVMMKDRPGLVASVEPVNAVLSEQERKGTCLQIQGLRKEFPSDDGEMKVAVQGLNLTLYAGQISALLGHNGAGKTTTISMLTGLIPPTSGDATLYGRSVNTDFNELRQIMGICPQHDVLFNELTVEEHLLLFGTMKHVPYGNLKEEVERMIREVGLVEKRKVAARNLSGGQKRKLSVALAFMGDSKLVFLDEPTSGMDPYSRRFTWNLLQRNRDDRVIVLTTHFMDEADILGDRIAIMADGQLCCAGSSLFLKNRYGAGYNLTMIKAPGCNVEAVGTFLRNFVPEAKCLSNFGSEVVFQLPSKSSGVFSTMLQVLDDEKHGLRIVQYGVSVTTLEEVFLRISQDREEEAAMGIAVCGVEAVDQIRKTSATSANSRGTLTGPISSEMTNRATLWSQYTALLTKRVRIAKRDKKNLLNAVCIPLLFLIILVSLPEIDVASFMTTSDYATELATSSRQGRCSSANFTLVTVPSSCDSYTFNYCELGVIDCNPSTCCDKTNVESPYYACNMCDGTSSSNPVTPCFNKYCLDQDGAKLQATLNAFLTSVVVMLAFAFVPAAIVAFIVREKNPIQNAKSLQLICGANVSAYWLSTWTHDIVIMMVTVIAAMIMVPLSDRTLTSSMEVWGVVCLVGSHALAVIPMAYLFSFKFKKHAVAQTSLLVFALCTGGLLSIFSFLCRLIDFDLTPGNSSDNLTLSSLDRNYLRWIFLLFPGYSLNNGIYEIATRKLSRSALYGSSSDTIAPPSFFGLWEGLGTDYTCTSCWDAVSGETCCVRNVFDLDVAGAPVAYAVVEIVLFMLLVFIVETRSLSWRPEKRSEWAPNEDDDVARERQKVERSFPTQNDSVFIRNLRQQYGDGGKVALDNLCLSIAKGECFGYLGINGAGKSTTMKVLTGEIAPTNGFVTLGGYDLSRDRDKARRVVGYCPQFDSLHDLLTVEEQLELYARLKGIPSNRVQKAVDQKIEEVGLTEYRTKLTRGLSGGNKRKLSTAIALIGSPSIIFLDEPSTGVDPSSRRKMWDVIANVCAAKESCVVLTTHSMEECEALCTRVGILVSGKLKCLGSVEHLKQKFGRGYIVEVKLREPSTSSVGRLQLEVYRILGGNCAGISQDQVVSLCSSLGVPNRAHEITNGEGNGSVLSSYLDTSGMIPIDVFCAWWHTENMGSALQEFFQSKFQGSQLIEHQGGHFRFQVPKQSLRPYAIFGLLEENKEQLHVSEYGVSETSLEHIFNTMAAQQGEEQLLGSARYRGD